MNNFSKIARCAIALGTTVLFVSCNKDDNSPAPAPTPAAPTLYQKLGGTTLVADPKNPGQMIEHGRLSYRSVVDSTITLIVTDIVAGSNGNLGAHFAPLVSEVSAGNTTNLAELSDNLTDFFSFNTGGTNPINAYSGLSMVEAHKPGTGAGMNPRMGTKATNANYNKFEGYVGAAAGLNGVTDPVIINEVVAVLESLRTQIVQAP